MFVAIRHGEKMYSNGKSETYKFDPPLTLQGRNNITERALELYLSYDFDLIISSPYHRCVQTAAIIKHVFFQFGKNIELEVDTLVSEYLGNQKNFRPRYDLRRRTRKYRPPNNEETIKDLDVRVKKFKSNLKKEGKRCLVVSHGLTLQRLCNKNFVDECEIIECKF